MEKKEIMKSVSKGVLCIALVVAVSYFAYPYIYPRIYPYLVAASGQGGEIKYGECITEGEVDSALKEYFRSDFEKYHSADAKGKLFCSSVVLWENNINENEKIVYADANCRDIIAVDNDLRGGSSSGSSGLFKINKQGDKWQVVAYDNRISPKETLQDWVRDNLALLPKTIYGNCNTAALWQKNLQNVGSEMGIKVPRYSFNYCSGDKDCGNGEVCKFRGLFDAYGIQSQCVKKCSNHRECGAGYTCRKQCLYGENGCPRTGVNVCTMDLIYPSFDKQNELPL